MIENVWDILSILSEHCGMTLLSLCAVGRCYLKESVSENWYYVNQFLGKILYSLNRAIRNISKANFIINFNMAQK